MNRVRLLGAAMVAASATGFAALAPASAGSTADNGGMTWRQRAVADNSGYTEPSLSIDKSGNIVVCSPGGPGTEMWISEDDGKSFRNSTTGVEEGTGGGDCEIHFLPDGTLLNSDLAISTSYIHTSKDLGKTWERADDAGPEQDRQWFASYNSGEPVAYHVYHGIAEEGEYYVKSTDGGKTWSDVPTPVNSADQLACTPNAVAKPGDTACLADQDYNTFSGPMLVDQKTGELYVVYGISDAATNGTSTGGFGNPRGLVVAHSTDGTTWTNKYAVVINGMVIDGEYVASGFPWGLIDPDGNVYVIFNSSEGGHYHTYYAYSTDHAATWSQPIKLDDNPLPEGATVFSTGASIAPGVVDFAWIESDDAENTDDPDTSWYINMAQVRDAATANPSITRSRISDHPIHRGDICLHGTLCQLAPNGLGGGSRSLGDFFELAIGPDGMAQAAWTDDGRVDEDGKALPKQVWWAKQSSGPAAFVSAPNVPDTTGGTGSGSGSGSGGSGSGGSGSGGSGTGSTPQGPIAATGLPSALPTGALLLLGLSGLALATRRRRDAAE
ncbi:MAG TPA: sialidase family protein [Mycobacteriales bacterium]|jgi:uncharacterized membrane protein YgcG|nr:sialidase family protein [Mycobacteriales bacterium]